MKKKIYLFLALFGLFLTSFILNKSFSNELSVNEQMVKKNSSLVLSQPLVIKVEFEVIDGKINSNAKYLEWYYLGDSSALKTLQYVEFKYNNENSNASITCDNDEIISVYNSLASKNTNNKTVKYAFNVGYSGSDDPPTYNYTKTCKVEFKTESSNTSIDGNKSGTPKWIINLSGATFEDGSTNYTAESDTAKLPAMYDIKYDRTEYSISTPLYTPFDKNIDYGERYSYSCKITSSNSLNGYTFSGKDYKMGTYDSQYFNCVRPSSQTGDWIGCNYGLPWVNEGGIYLKFVSQLNTSLPSSYVAHPLGSGDTIECNVNVESEIDHKIEITVKDVGTLSNIPLIGDRTYTSFNYSTPGNGDTGNCYSVAVDLNDGIEKDNVSFVTNNIDEDNLLLSCTDSTNCLLHACYKDGNYDSSVELKYKTTPEGGSPSDPPGGGTDPIPPISELLEDPTQVDIDEMKCDNEKVIVIDRVRTSDTSRSISYNAKIKTSGTTKKITVSNASSISVSDLAVLEEVCNKNGSNISGAKMSDVLGMKNLADVTINSDITTCSALISAITSSLTVSTLGDINKDYDVSNAVASIPVTYSYSSKDITPYKMNNSDNTITNMVFTGYKFTYTQDNCGVCFDDNRLDPTKDDFSEELFIDKCCSSDDERMTDEVKIKYCPYAACDSTPELTPGSTSFDEELYTTTCCSIIDKTKENYKNYCGKDSYSYKLPTCGILDLENSGYIYEAKKEGIDNENYKEVLSGVDYDGTSYIKEKNDYCTVACKEDVKFYFPGVAVNGISDDENSMFWIAAGQYFTFKSIGNYQTPTIYQKKTCISNYDTNNIATALFGTGSTIDNNKKGQDGLFYKYALAYSKYKMEIMAENFENNQEEGKEPFNVTNGTLYYNYYNNDDYKITLYYEVIYDYTYKTISSVKRYVCPYNKTGGCKLYLSNKEFIIDELETAYIELENQIYDIANDIKKCDTSKNGTYSTVAEVKSYVYDEMKKNPSNSDAIAKIELTPNVIKKGDSMTITYCKDDYTNCTTSEQSTDIEIEWPQVDESNPQPLKISIQNIKTEAEQVVSYSMKEELYTRQPDGLVISRSTYSGNFDGLNDRKILLGKVFPVDISTMGGMKVYEFEINNIGDKGRLDDFYLTKYNEINGSTLSKSMYACNYVVSNLITCPVAMANKSNSSLASVINNNTIAKASTCTTLDNCKFVKKDNKYVVSCPEGILGEEDDQTVSTPSIIEEGELAVSSRIVNLSNLFPNSREYGENWANSVGQAAILAIQNNGNGNDIYTKEPLYSIIIDANSIQEIRNYNKTHSYGDFELSCIENKGTECLSNFLTEFFPNEVAKARTIWKYYDEGSHSFIEKTER